MSRKITHKKIVRIRQEEADDQLLSISEMAELAGVCVNTLRIWDRKGKVLAFARTDGGQRRYHRDQLKDIHRYREEADTLLYVGIRNSHTDIAVKKLLEESGERGWRVKTVIASETWPESRVRKSKYNLCRLVSSGKFKRVLLPNKLSTAPMELQELTALCGILSVPILMPEDLNKDNRKTLS